MTLGISCPATPACLSRTSVGYLDVLRHVETNFRVISTSYRNASSVGGIDAVRPEALIQKTVLKDKSIVQEHTRTALLIRS